MASTDRDALVALFHSTGGVSWTKRENWDTDAELSKWHGIKVDDESRVVEVSLRQNCLKGVIPRQLGELRALQRLILWDNKLSGSIPTELGNLSELKEMSLFINQLSGSIPKELGALSKLEQLSLSSNLLTGPIPPELGNLAAIQHLNLERNQLSGPLPNELGALSELKNLCLSGNQLKALWDHTQDVRGILHDEGTDSESGGGVPSQLQRLLDVLDRCMHLTLSGNPWAEPPESIVSKGRKGIRDYYEDLHAEKCRIQRNSVKIVLVGQQGAGKTSLRQSIKANKAVPTVERRTESTVFADVEPMELGGASVRVYDCAGQAAYTGLLQMFLTPRSVCVLVCNAAAFANPGARIDGSAEGDCRKLEELQVCDWLRSISRRVPGNDVILVATKCDLVAGNPSEIGRRMEEACRAWLASWVRAGMEPVKVEAGVSLTSCCPPGIDRHGERSSENHTSDRGWVCDWRDRADDGSSPLSLPHRLVNDSQGLRGAQMVLPRSWDIALTVLEALERGRDPVEMTVLKLADSDRGEAADMARPKGGVYQGITMEELRAIWQETVDELAERDITVMNAQNALEGALSIREFEGSLVRCDMFVFLDVVWLTRILKPLLNHKDEETFDGFVRLGDTGEASVTLESTLDIASWHRFKNEGILEPRLAQAMWPAGLSEHVLSTLASLGLIFPLENDSAGGMAVLLRLRPDRPARVGEVVDTFRSSNTPVFSANWKFFLGVPPGAIEKALTRCCRIGGVQTFWRFGVLVHGGFGDGGDGGIFAVVLEYFPTDLRLTAQIYGDISNPAPWAALSYTMSAVRLMLLEAPGLRSKGFLQCPQHGDKMPLTPAATSTGDRLLLEGSGCPRCSDEIRGQGAAAAELLRTVDIRLDPGVILQEVTARFNILGGQYTFLRPPPSASEGREVLIQKIDELAAAVKEGLNEVKGRLDRVTESLQESFLCLKSLQAPNYPYPHLVAVEEIKSKGKKKSLLSKLRGLAMKDMALFFLCPLDMSKVPCGVNGEGYRFRKTRGWVKKLSPALQVAVVTAKVALKATSGLDVDMPNFLKAVSDGLIQEVAEVTLDEQALFRVLSGEENAPADMQRVTRASYEALEKFMGEEELNRRNNGRDGDGYVDFRENMQRVGDGKGGMVWIRTENVQKWQNLLSTAAH